MNIPFNKIYINENDKKHIMNSLETGIIDGEGPYTSKVKEFFRFNFGFDEFIPTTSGTHALEIAAMLSNVGYNDQVVTPSYAFPSSGNSIILRKGIPVFCEINEQTLCMDENDALNRMNKKTKSIMPIHYGGISCDMDIIVGECKQKNIILIEDAAQSIGSKYKDKYLGTLGSFGCLSFHSTKNVFCGEGGGLILNTSEENISRTYRIIQKGTDRNDFLNGFVDKYTWKEPGSSYVPSDILMALLYSKLLQMDDSQAVRKNIYGIYHESLIDQVGKKGLRAISFQPEYSQSNYHMFYLIFENEVIRNLIMNKLRDKGISAYFHYMPLHLSDIGKKLGYKKGDFPVTERISKCILRLPLYNSMTMDEADYVVDSLLTLLKEI